MKESEWSNDPALRPKSSLYFVKLDDPKQVRITNPPKEESDSNPIYLPTENKLTWLRGSELTPKNDLWIAELSAAWWPCLPISLPHNAFYPLG